MDFIEGEMKNVISLKAALSKKATEIVLLDLRGLSNIADYFMIMSANSDRHSQAIAEEILKKMEEKGHKPLGIEGFAQGHWVLLDFDELVIHIFFEPVRKYYDLEGLWVDAPRINWEERYNLKEDL
ncbi:MAG TPA: ribosome silencing factor [Candidatus Desulfofervidus auxilii]|uniref:Ribosomal silencing factor RsfS n=1 Tax=Desulfofervidus auxilii TaxID=1621989 RepID=A0A7C0YAN3_DESA2|nr:ribosome silencing factor [Candidatus Desulfofervidus auxilii]